MLANKTFILPAALLLAGSLFLPLQACARSAYWEQKVSLFDKLPVHENDIVFLGNSITDGGEWQELLNMANVKNRGISADVISGVRDRLHQVTDGHPKKIFLLIGINDVSHNLGAGKIASEYEKLVQEIRTQSPETQLYIQSVMPINNDFGRYKNLKGQEKTVTQLNEKLKTIADEHGAIYVDLWPALADPATGKLKRNFTNDGLHLTGEGYRAWIDLIRPLVTEGVEIVPLDKTNKERR
ncbi:MAG: sialate O-acetylesterase [Bacteroidales bacterium]|nr:sialate O-acetylesterase [Bacteroidales bacterium]MBD5201001.1 sialate O-acetylesterase [Bacteroidales bacterium]MBD5218578.1 sialate O-acetylesterase [Bacteroidales bacterium]